MEVKLMELVGEWQQVADMMNDPEVEEQTIIDTLEGITGEIEVKADGYGSVIRSLEYEVSALKGKKEYVKGILDDITAEEKRLQGHIDWMKTRLLEAMIAGRTTKALRQTSLNLRSRQPGVCRNLKQPRMFRTTLKRSFTRMTTKRYGNTSRIMM